VCVWLLFCVHVALPTTVYIDSLVSLSFVIVLAVVVARQIKLSGKGICWVMLSVPRYYNKVCLSVVCCRLLNDALLLPLQSTTVLADTSSNEDLTRIDFRRFFQWCARWALLVREPHNSPWSTQSTKLKLDFRLHIIQYSTTVHNTGITTIHPLHTYIHTYIHTYVRELKTIIIHNNNTNIYYLTY
jgi:hypothetical protein